MLVLPSLREQPVLAGLYYKVDSVRLRTLLISTRALCRPPSKSWRQPGHRPRPLLCVFCGPILVALKTSFREILGYLRLSLGRFSLGLALKKLLGRNKVVRLGLFWVVFRFKHVNFKFINQSKLVV